MSDRQKSLEALNRLLKNQMINLYASNSADEAILRAATQQKD